MTKIATLATFLLLAAAPLAHADPQPAAAHGPYRIVPGDVLDVIVWRNKELSLQVTVRPDGWISYPLASDVKVAGQTVVDVQKKLEESLSKYVTSPMVTVVVTRVANLRVSVLGKVRQPGRYNLDGPTTVLDVLALAGGLTEFADPDGIYILRAGSTADALYERIPAKYSSSISAGKSNTNVAVMAGDIIIVP
jgi:polysaccharide biosynthesis/export protein